VQRGTAAVAMLWMLGDVTGSAAAVAETQLQICCPQGRVHV